MGRVLTGIVGRPVAMSDCWRVGRFSPDRPRPIIIRFDVLAEKVAVLRAKGVLYGGGCPADLEGLRLYHDLSAGQLDWKRCLRAAFDNFIQSDIRAVWRHGYRLFALEEGVWVEYYPSSVLVGH